MRKNNWHARADRLEEALVRIFDAAHDAAHDDERNVNERIGSIQYLASNALGGDHAKRHEAYSEERRIRVESFLAKHLREKKKEEA